ncbi:MAG: phage tail fiber protein [Frankiaceae bacterium]
MAIAITAEKNSLATKYGTDAPYGAIFTADPGTTGTATGEVTGGSPAYARKAISWGAPANGVITGTATFDVPAGTTVTFAAVCASATAGTADLKDRISVTSQNFASQGTYAVTFTYTQT